ncbi:MAG: molybdenum cofactor guanylyltransferase [Actinomycetota bacterium]
MTASGVVLAGGRSSRFGADKLAAEIDGVSVLQHAATRVAEAAGEVVVVLAPGSASPAFPPGLPVRVAFDAREGEGPLQGLLAGLLAVRTEHALVAGGDMPALSPLVLSELLRVAEGAPVDAAVLADGDRFRPLPCAVRVAPAIANARALLHDGERRLRSLLDSLRLAVIDEATWTALDPERATLRDVDEPADLDGGHAPGG